MFDDLSHSRVLIVDDTKANIDILVAALGKKYKLSVALDGNSALAQARENAPDLILLDVMMPAMDGFEVCSQLKSDPSTSSIPIIFITALDETDYVTKGFKLGAVDYITKPFRIPELNARVHTQLSLRHAMLAYADQNRILDIRVKESTRELKDTQLEIIYRLSRAAEYRDNDTGMHLKRLSHMSKILAAAWGCDEETCELIFNASPMHDIGKIGIPDAVLLKPGRLDAAEWKIMQTHTTIGKEILSGHDSLLIRMGGLIALTHHEKWNGAGYPQGLSEYQIPQAGRMVAICDVFDALTSRRPYKEPWHPSDAFDEIRAGSGAAFDPKLVDCFLKCRLDLIDVIENLQDEIKE
ncbi:MAG: response regulator [Syntrophobacteraceae bacterium]|nr:response regulator [Syntrophobacteraceae bacterium]